MWARTFQISAKFLGLEDDLAALLSEPPFEEYRTLAQFSGDSMMLILHLLRTGMPVSQERPAERRDFL